MHVTLLDATDPHWGSQVEQIGVLLGAGENPTLFPYHFLYVTLSKIGGYIANFTVDGRPVGVGFLFPRHFHRHSSLPRRIYTLRHHNLLAPAVTVDPTAIAAACSAALGGAEVVYYDPAGALAYDPTHQTTGAVDVGRPTRTEADATRLLQQQIWGSPPEFLYPTDLHSCEFAAGTSLVARVDGTPAGFLFGFYKFGGPRLPADWETRFHGAFRLESQTLAVLPAYRGLRIANLLKKSQAQHAWAAGIGIVNWTTDPLQYPNAALNFGLLRAVAFEFAANLYPFRNELNRVPASRFALTWLVGTKQVRELALVGERTTVVDLSHRRQVPKANDGWRNTTYNLSAELIAIEIPTDWTALQQNDIAQAQAWRAVTDDLFHHYIGIEPGKYVVTGAAADGDRRYLIAERASDTLWARLGMAESDG